jgi:hypothetical protein
MYLAQYLAVFVWMYKCVVFEKIGEKYILPFQNQVLAVAHFKSSVMLATFSL